MFADAEEDEFGDELLEEDDSGDGAEPEADISLELATDDKSGSTDDASAETKPE